jgi:MOSC domain-containing protein YiiM
MEIVSLNVGLPRTVVMDGKQVTTGIFKEPIAGHIAMRRLNFDGDRQADLGNHGGVNKAIYLYPYEHYAFWTEELGQNELPWGSFGENVTTEGLNEREIRIGDRLRVGSAVVMITQPRMPCFKLAGKFGLEDLPRRFLASGRTGFYAAVSQEGLAGTADPIEVVFRDERNPTVAEIVSLQQENGSNPQLLKRAVETEALSEGWRERFRRRLAEIGR